MGLLQKLLSRGQAAPRVFVLGLDGAPRQLLEEAIASGLMPNLANIWKKGQALFLRAPLPYVSTVAWASYATGTNPGQHGIFGFVDRNPSPFSVAIPTARDLKTITLWEVLSKAQRKVGVINVPLTFPPKQVNGFMVGCFLSPDLANAAFPVELAPRLMQMDYRIEANSDLARTDPPAYLDDLGRTMGRRFGAALKLMETEPWDFFHLHIMGIDRVNHFFLDAYEERDAELSPQFFAFYRKLDSYLGDLSQALPPGCRLLLVSDHGFCRTHALVYINHWLEANGYLHFARGKKELLNMHPDSRAYSLVPGRVYLNLKGREENGCVSRGREYEDLRDELIHRLSGLTHPKTNQPLVGRIFRREEIYRGPRLERAADLIIEPRPGFDLKANLDGPGLLGPPDLPGMHDPRGSFVFFGEQKHPLQAVEASILDMAPTILNILGVEVPASMEGDILI